MRNLLRSYTHQEVLVQLASLGQANRRHVRKQESVHLIEIVIVEEMRNRVENKYVNRRQKKGEAGSRKIICQEMSLGRVLAEQSLACRLGHESAKASL